MLEVQITITGIEQFDELRAIINQLNKIEFRLLRSPSGEVDLEASLRDLDAAIDRKLSRFSRSGFAPQVAAAAKQQLRQQIRRVSDQIDSLHGSPLIPISKCM